MSRRRRRARSRRRQKPPNRWLIAVQLLVLSGLLVFLVLFRDYLAESASEVVDSFTSSDLQVQRVDGGDGGPVGSDATAPREPTPRADDGSDAGGDLE